MYTLYSFYIACVYFQYSDCEWKDWCVYVYLIWKTLAQIVIWTKMHYEMHWAFRLKCFKTYLCVNLCNWLLIRPKVWILEQFCISYIWKPIWLFHSVSTFYNSVFYFWCSINVCLTNSWYRFQLHDLRRRNIRNHVKTKRKMIDRYPIKFVMTISITCKIDDV